MSLDQDFDHRAHVLLAHRIDRAIDLIKDPAHWCRGWGTAGRRCALNALIKSEAYGVMDIGHRIAHFNDQSDHPEVLMLLTLLKFMAKDGAL